MVFFKGEGVGGLHLLVFTRSDLSLEKMVSYIGPQYITEKTYFPPYDFSIHLKQFSHPEDGGNMLLRNFGTFRHCKARKPKTRP